MKPVFILHTVCEHICPSSFTAGEYNPFEISNLRCVMSFFVKIRYGWVGTKNLVFCCGNNVPIPFYMPVSRRSVLCDWVWRAGGRPHRFLHNNFSSVYQIFTKLGHMIPLWKGKTPIYFEVIRSKVKVTVTINIIFDNRVVSAR